MIINYESREPVKKTFNLVAVGDVFVINRTAYMKTKVYKLISEVSVNCISLSSGNLELMSDAQEVELVESTLTIIQ